VFDALDELVAEYADVLQQLSDPAVIADQRRLREVSRRHHELEPVVAAYRAYRDTSTDLELAQDMLADAESAATAAEGQLATLYPGVPAKELWGRTGITQMPGIDDFGADETFPVSQAPALEHWAAAHGIGELSIWALQRDNGNCPGTKGAGNCSGVTQQPWDFSHAFEPFSYLPRGA